jgi:hypothetical protein
VSASLVLCVRCSERLTTEQGAACSPHCLHQLLRSGPAVMAAVLPAAITNGAFLQMPMHGFGYMIGDSSAVR